MAKNTTEDGQFVSSASKKKGAFETDFDVDAPILTDAEIEELRAEARAAVTEERKKAARKTERDKLIRAEKVRQGLIPSSANMEKVSVQINVPDFANPIVLDGKQYHKNMSYTVEHAVAQTLMDKMFRAHGHQTEIDGKRRFAPEQRTQRLGLSPKGIVNNARLELVA